MKTILNPQGIMQDGTTWGQWIPNAVKLHYEDGLSMLMKYVIFDNPQLQRSKFVLGQQFRQVYPHNSPTKSWMNVTIFYMSDNTSIIVADVFVNATESSYEFWVGGCKHEYIGNETGRCLSYYRCNKCGHDYEVHSSD